MEILAKETDGIGVKITECREKNRDLVRKEKLITFQIAIA
jgi:hypothetical protein